MTTEHSAQSMASHERTDKAMSDAPPALCRLLALPPELRNLLYELAFTTADAGDKTKITHACGPSPILLLTCRQVHFEATPIFQHAQNHYWSTGKFELAVKYGGELDEDACSNLAACGTEYIKNFTLRSYLLHPDRYVILRHCELVPDGWRVRVSQLGGTSIFEDTWCLRTFDLEAAGATIDIISSGNVTEKDKDSRSAPPVSLRDQVARLLRF
ncbi:hypothetical protein LTR85_005445 [Meristemomyces frigidus]|nr:hypothetical protein LTR85_005445 [Meristemomyces frigidus]